MRRRNIVILIFLSALLIIVYLANRPNTPAADEDQGTAVDHDGSVETAISVQHADSTHDIVLTSHKVWIKNSEYATIVHRDTIPSLDSLTTTVENDRGDSKVLRLKKDYQIFITVK
jgi:hypothetical protein